MAGELMRDLPDDLPTFPARFGTDTQCRAYLTPARWPEGFRCAGCGHGRAYGHRVGLIEACVACDRQHSLLAGPSSRPSSRHTPPVVRSVTVLPETRG